MRGAAHRLISLENLIGIYLNNCFDSRVVYEHCIRALLLKIELTSCSISIFSNLLDNEKIICRGLTFQSIWQSVSKYRVVMVYV
jgi:hypothetical protein